MGTTWQCALYICTHGWILGLKSVLFAAAGGNLVPLVFLEKQFEPRPFVLLVVGCAL